MRSGTSGCYQEVVSRVGRAGLVEKHRRFMALHIHTLRKYFRTWLEVAGVSQGFRERLLGHKGGYLDESYFRPMLDQIKAEYVKAIPFLTIEAEGEQVKQIQKELEEERRKRELIEQKLKTLEDLLLKLNSSRV